MSIFFAVTAPGLAAIAAEELVRLGLLPDVSPVPAIEEGGVTFRGDIQMLYQANLHLRTASRVLVRMGDFYATAFSELRKKAGLLAWEEYLTIGQPVTLAVTCRKSRLYHSGAVGERVVAAISDRLGHPTKIMKSKEDDPTNEPAQMIIVRLINDRVTISIDSSGALLHRRGYRLASAKAPIRETLAAAMLLASGWVPSSPLIDPFCGSGTIPIEAALLASGRQPGCVTGTPRHFAFMDWPSFNSRMWEAVLIKRSVDFKANTPTIQASDRDAGAIRMAQANADRAGVLDQIDFSQRAVSAIEPPQSVGWIVTNPPYGQRVSSNHDLRNLYAQLGNVLRAKCPSWQVAILCSDLKLLGQTGLHLDSSFSTVNGGIPVRLGRGTIE